MLPVGQGDRALVPKNVNKVLGVLIAAFLGQGTSPRSPTFALFQDVVMGGMPEGCLRRHNLIL